MQMGTGNLLAKMNAMLRGRSSVDARSAAPTMVDVPALDSVRKSLAELQQQLDLGEERLARVSQQLAQMQARLDAIPDARPALSTLNTLGIDLHQQQQQLETLRVAQSDLMNEQSRRSINVDEIQKQVETIKEAVASIGGRDESHIARVDAVEQRVGRLGNTVSATIRVMDDTRDAFIARDDARLGHMKRELGKARFFALAAMAIAIISAVLVLARLALTR
jgi:chromosome segregation ATPase